MLRAARIALPLLVVAAVFAAFAPALEAGFVDFDDDRNITANPHFRGLSAEHLAWMFTTNRMGPYQPLSWLSLAVDHALYGLSAPEFPEAWGYHLTNVALHALAALAVYLLALRLFARAAPEAAERGPLAARIAAAVAALFFAVHPLRVESVAWVTERRDVLSGLFYALAAWAWLAFVPRGSEARWRAGRYAGAAIAAGGAVVLFFLSVDLSGAEALAWRGPGAVGLALAAALLAASALFTCSAVRYGGERPSARWFLVALALFTLALLSKGLAMVLPAVLVVADLWPLQRWRCRYAREGARGPARASPLRALPHLVLEKVPFLALAGVFAALAMWGQRAQAGNVVGWYEHTLAERVAQALYGLAFYPWKTFLPLGLSPLVDLPETVRLTAPRFLVAAVAVAAAAALLVLMRRRLPALPAAAAAFALAVAPVLGLSQAGPQLVADRYSYLSCLPFALLAGGALLAWSKRGAGALRIGAPLALAWLAALAFLAHRQARIWRDSETLWSHAVAVAPEDPLANLNLGRVLAERAQSERDPARRRGLLAQARGLFERGLAVEENPRLVSNLGQLHAQLAEVEPGRRGEHGKQALELARRALELSLEKGQFLPEYRLLYGRRLLEERRCAEAADQIRRHLRIRPAHARARLDLGFALLCMGRPQEAAAELERSVELDPTDPDAWGTLGQAREALGERSRAVQAYRRVLALVPEHPLARARLEDLGG